MKKIFIMAVVGILLIGFNSKFANAETILDSNISGEVHLTLAQSPYLAPEEGVTVQEGGNLIIEPGVTVLFPEEVGLHIMNGGELSVLRATNRITRLKGQNGVPWGGISISDQAHASLDSLEIENAKIPIDVENSRAEVKNVILDGNKNFFEPDRPQYGIKNTRSQLTVSSSTISNFETAGIFQQSGQSRIEKSIITGNNTGILYKIYVFPFPVKGKGSFFENILGFLYPAHVLAESEGFPLIAGQNVLSGNDLNAQNLSPENTLDMRNNFWGSESGPGQTVEGNILFSPWLPASPFLESIGSCCSNILFIPGFEGTRLNKGDNQLWEPNRNADVEKLYLNSAGQSIDPSVTVGDIIKKTNIGFGIFDQSIYHSFTLFLDRLKNNGTVKNWRPYPYDWRMDLPVAEAINIVRNLAGDSKTSRVTLIGHSNGGLIAKKITEELKRTGEENLIDLVIMIATPQTGSPSVVSALLHGDDQSLGAGIILNKATAREFGNNLTGAYNLLPSSSYLAASPLISFATSTDLSSDLRSLYGNALSSFVSVKNFLLGLIDHRSNPPKAETEKPALLNGFIFGKAVNNHSWLDPWHASSSISLYQIGAYGIPTSNGIGYYSKKYCAQTAGPTCLPQYAFQHENKKTSEGDGTVPVKSSLFMNAPAYLFNVGGYDSSFGKKFSHADLLEAEPIQDIVENIIKKATSTTPSSYITYNENGYDSSMMTSSPVIRRYAVHSPVSLEAYDSEGRRTGVARSPDTSSDITFVDMNIPGSTYEEIGTDKYIYVSGDQPLRFEMKGTGSGLFSFDVQENNNNEEARTLASFTDIPVMEGTIATTETSSTTSVPVSLKVDVDGNGSVDLIVDKNAGLSTLDYINIFIININDLHLPLALQQRMTRITNRLRLLAAMGRDEVVIRKLKNFYLLLESRKIRNRHLHPADLTNLTSLISTTLNALESN